jgi:hypothetical protein
MSSGHPIERCTLSFVETKEKGYNRLTFVEGEILFERHERDSGQVKALMTDRQNRHSGEVSLKTVGENVCRVKALSA